MPGTPAPITVGRVGRAHGIKGEVTIDVRTDAPDLRFAAGVTLGAGKHGTLTVARSHWHSNKLLVAFEGVTDRNRAEELSGTWLTISQDDAGDAGDDAYWDHELIGLNAYDPTGELLGEVTDVHHHSAQPLLIVKHDGRDVMVPFVGAIVTAVDLPGGRLTIDPPGGLFNLEELT